VNSKYGNVTKYPDNQTYIGGAMVYIFKKISNFTTSLIVRTIDGKIVTNRTANPCNRAQRTQKMKNLMDQVLDFPSGLPNTGPPRILCPCEVNSNLLFDLKITF
jgi:hypothetical protein